MAWARFEALRRNVPRWLKKEQVADYHSILDALQRSSGEDLSAFRILDDHLKPRARSGPQGENWYVDRDRIIDALAKRHNALRAGLPPPAPSNVVNVGTMYGSAIQQGTEQSSVMVDYKASERGIRDLLKQIRESVNALAPSPAARAQLEADAQTAEAQLASQHPKPMIIRECLKSIRDILEGMTGGLIASGPVFEIGKYTR